MRSWLRTNLTTNRHREHMSKLRDFIEIFHQYRSHHGIVYAARIAYGCAFNKLPF